MRKITFPLILISLFILGGCSAKPAPLTISPTASPSARQLVGNDKDAHGCIGSAGYSWCESKQKCLRPWEEPCTEKWSGTWTNSLGEKGNDTLEISTDSAGNIKGVWSGNINITGQWSDSSNLKFSGQTTTRDYQVTGKIENNILILNYTATRLNTSGTYTGEEKLTKVSP
jgi:hypothetical protein